MIYSLQRCIIDYKLSSDIFNIYRHLYNGAGAEKLATEFCHVAVTVINQNLDTKDLFAECHDAMCWAHDGMPPVDRETWLCNTFDLLSSVVCRIKKHPEAYKLGLNP